MSLELFINSGSIPEINLSTIEGVRFEDVFSVSSPSCATLKYNTGTFIYPNVAPEFAFTIQIPPETNYFMFDEDCSSDWDGTTPTTIRLNLKALGRLVETTNYQQKLFEIIKNRLVNSEISITKKSAISESDPSTYKTFQILEASYFERNYDTGTQKFYAIEWGGNVLTETADFFGLFNYLPVSAEDRKDGFFTLVVTQTDTSSNLAELPVDDDELLICITPSKKYGFFEGVSGSFDSINITNVDITSASLESLFVDGDVNVTGSLLVNGDDLKVIVGRTQFGSLLINYDTDTSTDPGNHYFKYSTGPGESPSELALSMVIYENNKFVTEASNYEKTWKEIEDKKYIGSTITLKNLKSLDYKVLRINSIESSGYPTGFIKFGVTELDAGTDPFRLPAIDDEYSVNFDVKLETKTIEKKIFTESGFYSVPKWATKITVIAIGGGGGGGGGVGIIRDGNYVYGDSKDIAEAASVELKRYSYELNPIADYEDEPTYFEEIIGGGGGAGGNVVYKQFTVDQLPTGTTCYIFVGAGGKGSRGGYGKIIKRYKNDNQQYIWDGFENGNPKEIPNFKVQNSVVIKGKIIPYNIEKRRTQGTTLETQLYTRGGEQIYVTDENSDEYNLDYANRKKHTTRLQNSGGDSIFEFMDNSESIYRVRAEGGFGGKAGFALPNTGRAPYGRGGAGGSSIEDGYYVLPGIYTDFDNLGTPYAHDRIPYYSYGGKSHTQYQRSGLFDEILNGGPGGFGVSMYFRGFERFKNYAPNLPLASVPTDKGGDIGDYGNVIPADGPAGGGGGYGANIHIIKLREKFITDNPASDINIAKDIGDPLGYIIDDRYIFGYTLNEIGIVGKGGKSSNNYLKISSLPSDYLSDIPFGIGGNSGNGLTLPFNNISPSEPTPGGLYGGGGGGGASLYFDADTPVDEIKGQDGADGGAGVVVVIAQN